MKTKENIIQKYKTYVLIKSLYNTLSIILSYFIIVSSIPLILTLGDIEKLNSKGLGFFILHIREIIKTIYNLVPLKDNILTALGALVLTLFINVRSENKEINGKSGHEVSIAKAYKTFSNIIIYILGFIMFINFCAKILLGDTINSNDQIYPWVSLFFMLFILMIRSLEGDSVDSLKKQILRTQSRISVINVHQRTPITPKDNIKYNNILYRYEHLRPFRDLRITSLGYIKLKYNARNVSLKVLLQFIFMLYIFYTTLSITRTPYFPLVEQDCTLGKFIQCSIQALHQMPHITPKDAILVCLFSIITPIIFIIFDFIYKIYSTHLNLHSEKGLHGHTHKIIYWIIELFKLAIPASFLSFIISDSIYTFLEVPLSICTLIILIIGYFIINYESNKSYIQRLNQDLGLPINQSLNETKTSAELYYLNTKLESLYDTLKTMLEETQDNYIQWKNSSNIDSDNINSPYE